MLTNTHSGHARELLAGTKSPWTNVAFSITLPAGVSLNAYKAYPKLPAGPVYNNQTGLVTWAVGDLRPGKRVKLSLKLVAGTCTTPAPLSLKGTFAYQDAAGPKTAEGGETKKQCCCGYGHKNGGIR